MAGTKAFAPFDCVVFGATGDLTQRKLMPALYYRFRDGQVPPEARIIGAARSDLDDAAFRDQGVAALRTHVAEADLDDAILGKFLAALHYVRIDGTTQRGWDVLAELLDAERERVRVFYLATSPDLYGPICANIGQAGLNTPEARVVLEKPIGHDLESARQINDLVGQVFSESQTYRIDHFLGKETVQNIMALRFANGDVRAAVELGICIDHVQITVAETVGRGNPRPASMKKPARCATWCRTTCCSCCACSRWKARHRSTPTRSATRS